VAAAWLGCGACVGAVEGFGVGLGVGEGEGVGVGEWKTNNALRWLLAEYQMPTPARTTKTITIQNHGFFSTSFMAAPFRESLHSIAWGSQLPVHLRQTCYH
jgi:hypothetical protein